MINYQKIAAIVIRGFAVSFFISTLVEVAIIATDAFFVQAGIYPRSEIAIRPRIMMAAFFFIGSSFLYFKSEFFVEYLMKGLEEPEPREGSPESESPSA
jgi:Sec-independent protein secretion pathway component TatC